MLLSKPFLRSTLSTLLVSPSKLRARPLVHPLFSKPGIGIQFAKPSSTSSLTSFPHHVQTGTKRQRNDETQDTTARRLQHTIDRQTVEFQKLKSEKESVVHAYKELSATHEKVQNENKVLKKVVAIKQERQDQYIAELDNLKRHKEYSDNLITAMRNHIQNQQLHSNSGMGFNSGGPPNVY